MSYIESYIIICTAMLSGVVLTCLFGAIIPGTMPKRWLLVYAAVFAVMAVSVRPLLMAIVIQNQTGL
jgi:hypothetical protein